MKRRDLFKWIGLGVAVAVVPAPLRALVKAVTPEPIKKRLLAYVAVDVFGKGDARSIQEGVDMLSPMGGVVHIRPGKYVIERPIKLKGNISIVGSGAEIDVDADDIAVFDVEGDRNSITNLVVSSSNNRKYTAFIMERPSAKRSVFSGNSSL